MSNFSQIQTFIEVANSKSFAEASRRLSIPKSTVSARVKALEKRLNVRLLTRNTRSVTLTSEGLLYLERCQEALDTLLDIEDEITQTSQVSGKIRITVPIDLPSMSLAERLTQFVDLYPKVDIEVLVTDEPQDLINNHIDLALRGHAPGALGLIARKVAESELSLFASPDYIKQNLSGQTSIEDLHDKVVFDPVGIYDKATRVGQLHTRNFNLVKSFAVHGEAVVLLPNSMCESEIQSGRLLKLGFKQPLPKLPLYLVYPNRQHLPVRVRVLIDFLLSEPFESSLV